MHEFVQSPSSLSDVNQLHSVLNSLEVLSEDLAADRQQLIELDRKQNHNRETLRQLKNIDEGKSVWTFGGSFFIKQPVSRVKKTLEEEQKTVEKEKETTRKAIKTKAYQISSMEGKVADVSGFFLQPLGKEDTF